MEFYFRLQKQNFGFFELISITETEFRNFRIIFVIISAPKVFPVQDRQKDAQQTDSPTSTRPGLQPLCQNTASNGWSIQHIDLKIAFNKGETSAPDRDVVCQLFPEASKPWYLAARLKKPANGMSDAPRKWWDWLDAAVKAMGLCPARADRCTYVSYSDVKKHKKTHMAHSTDASEDRPSIGDPMPSLND